MAFGGIEGLTPPPGQSPDLDAWFASVVAQLRRGVEDIDPSAITPGTARQLLQTNAGGTAAEWASNIAIPGTLAVTGVTTFSALVTIDGVAEVLRFTRGTGTVSFFINNNSNFLTIRADAGLSLNDTGGSTTVGGTLAVTEAVTLTVPLATANTVAKVVSVTGGDGINSTGGENPSISVDTTVIRTTGNQILGGIKTFSSDIALSSAISVIRLNTADGSDNSQLSLTGGGATGPTRGGTITLYGNEHAAIGKVVFQLGNIAGSQYEWFQGVSNNIMTLDEDGNLRLDGNLHINQAITDANALLKIDQPTGNSASLIQLNRIGVLRWQFGASGGTDTNDFVFFRYNDSGVFQGNALSLSRSTGVGTFESDVILAATKKLYLDGGTNTYIVESSADLMLFVTNGGSRLQISTTQVQVIAGTNLQSPSDTGLGTIVSSSTRVNIGASSTSQSCMRLTHGSTPTSPVDGDMWTTSSGLFVRVNGVTVGPLIDSI